MFTVELKEKEFALFKALIYDASGISLSESKTSLVKSRLAKRLRALNLQSYNDYYQYIQSHTEEIGELLNAMSTNVTSFFREPTQWEYLRNYFHTADLKGYQKKIRIWSSAASTGQEPYSIAIALLENLPDASKWSIKILATDMDTKVLAKAQKGLYSDKEIGDLSSQYLEKYFDLQMINGEKNYQVKKSLRNLITFRSFNLVRGNYSVFSNRFDMIFCRNVMIYFDGATRAALLKNFHAILKQGGHLFIGHSESLTTMSDYYSILKPSIYKRK